MLRQCSRSTDLIKAQNKAKGNYKNKLMNNYRKNLTKSQNYAKSYK
jgi:hypothetical protein